MSFLLKTIEAILNKISYLTIPLQFTKIVSKYKDKLRVIEGLSNNNFHYSHTLSRMCNHANTHYKHNASLTQSEVLLLWAQPTRPSYLSPLETFLQYHLISSEST